MDIPSKFSNFNFVTYEIVSFSFNSGSILIRGYVLVLSTIKVKYHFTFPNLKPHETRNDARTMDVFLSILET